jgi:cytochrome c553
MIPIRRERSYRAFGALVAWLSVLGVLEDAGAQTTKLPEIVTVCAPCHGINGSGRDVETPNIAGQSGIYLYSQLMAFRNGTRKHPEMKAIARELTDREIQQIVAYYSILPSP